MNNDNIEENDTNVTNEYNEPLRLTPEDIKQSHVDAFKRNATWSGVLSGLIFAGAAISQLPRGTMLQTIAFFGAVFGSYSVKNFYRYMKYKDRVSGKNLEEDNHLGRW